VFVIYITPKKRAIQKHRTAAITSFQAISADSDVMAIPTNIRPMMHAPVISKAYKNRSPSWTIVLYSPADQIFYTSDDRINVPFVSMKIQNEVKGEMFRVS